MQARCRLFPPIRAACLPRRSFQFVRPDSGRVSPFSHGKIWSIANVAFISKCRAIRNSLIETKVHGARCDIWLDWKPGCTFPWVGWLTCRRVLEKMELTRLHGGHFFTAPFLFTHLKGGLIACSWERIEMQECMPQEEERECGSVSIFNAVKSGDLPASTSVIKYSSPS